MKWKKMKEIDEMIGNQKVDKTTKYWNKWIELKWNWTTHFHEL